VEHQQRSHHQEQQDAQPDVLQQDLGAALTTATAGLTIM
jgi:hypothetical protein